MPLLFSAVLPTPDTTGEFDLMGFPAGEDSVRKIKNLKPAAEIVAEMMAEAREIAERTGGDVSTRLITEDQTNRRHP